MAQAVCSLTGTEVQPLPVSPGRSSAHLHLVPGAGLILTTYEGLRRHRELLLPIVWGAVVLDEGHKIRNPDADITLVAKQVLHACLL